MWPSPRPASISWWATATRSASRRAPSVAASEPGSRPALEPVDGWEQLGPLLAARAPIAEPQSPAEDDLALIMYTSGTTGRPKGAMLTHGNFFWNNVNALLCLDTVSSDVSYCAAPLFHIGGVGYALLLLGGVVLALALAPGLDALALGDVADDDEGQPRRDDARPRRYQARLHSPVQPQGRRLGGLGAPHRAHERPQLVARQCDVLLHAEQLRGGGCRDDQQRRVHDDGDVVHPLQHGARAVGQRHRGLYPRAGARAQRDEHEPGERSADQRADRQRDERELGGVHPSSVGWASTPDATFLPRPWGTSPMFTVAAPVVNLRRG